MLVLVADTKDGVAAAVAFHSDVAEPVFDYLAPGGKKMTGVPLLRGNVPVPEYLVPALVAVVRRLAQDTCVLPKPLPWLAKARLAERLHHRGQLKTATPMASPAPWHFNAALLLARSAAAAGMLP